MNVLKKDKFEINYKYKSFGSSFERKILMEKPFYSILQEIVDPAHTALVLWDVQ
jgi:hypothetical protein